MSSDDLLIGVLIGLILTLTGAGGSVIASPLLVIFSGVSINDATGLALAAVCVSSACLSVYGYRRAMFSIRPVFSLALSGMLMASLARLVVEDLDSRLMGILFSMMALSFSVYYLLGDRLHRWWRRRFPLSPLSGPGAPPGQLALPVWGALAGALSGFFGIGGGIVLMPIVLQILRVPISHGIYYCLPVICLITLTGSLTFMLHAEAEILGHLLWLTLGALSGSALGLALLPLVNRRISFRLLGVAVLFFGGTTLYRALG